MTDQPNTRRDLSKLRTIPLDDVTYRRMRLYCHGLHEDGEAGEVIARVAGEAIGAWLDRQERGGCDVDPRLPGESVASWANRVAVNAGDPSEGEGELYGRWRQ